MAMDEVFYKELVESDKKWEYLVLDLTENVHALDQLGKTRWELVAIDNGFAYLKRRYFKKTVQAK